MCLNYFSFVCFTYYDVLRIMMWTNNHKQTCPKEKRNGYEVFDEVVRILILGGLELIRVSIELSSEEC